MTHRAFGTTRLAWAIAGVVVASGVAAFWSSPAAAAGGGDAPTAGRLLLLSLPGLTWAEVQEHELPAIEGFLADAALADLAPRGVSPRATAGAAYLTVSAGARATSDPLIDGQQLAVEERSGGSTAGEIFTRRTGVEPDGAYVSLVWPTLVRDNADEPYDAELGLLAETLSEADLGTAAIGNADGTDMVGRSYERQVGLAMAATDGVIAAGEMSDDLLVDDPTRPFGERLDGDLVAERFRQVWESPGGRDGGVVVVEASDLARTMRYRDRVDLARYEELRAEALADSDALVGRLLAEVDPAHDAVLLMAPYNLRDDRDLTVAALRAPRSEAGYLRSASTQRSGFVTLVDVGPTVLDLFGLERPVAMEGRPFEVVPSDHPLDVRVDRLASLNAASRFRERLLFPTTLFVVLVLAVVCAAAAVVIARGVSTRARPWIAFAALANLAVLPLSYIARGFPLEDLGAGFYWTFVILGAVVVAGTAWVLASRLRRPRLALVMVLALVLGVLLLDVMTGSRLSLSAAFGYSPTGNSRLYGISNYSFGMAAASSCLLAALLAASRPPRRAKLAAIGLVGVVLVVIGVPVWGSDVGGVLAFTPTVLLFAALVLGYRVRLRTALIGVLVTVAAVTAFGLLDLARPPARRAHLGRLFERVADEGIQPLVSVIERKLLANLRVTTTSFWIAAIPVAVAFLVFLACYPTRPLDRIRRRVPTLQAGLVAAAVAAVLGSAVNDSGAIVGGVTLMVMAASLAYLALEPEASPQPPAVPSHVPLEAAKPSPAGARSG